MLFDFVQRVCPIFDCSEIDTVEVYLADGAVVHRTEVDGPMGNIRRRSPLCCARNVGWSGPFAEFDTDGDIEVVQNLETLEYRVGT